MVVVWRLQAINQATADQSLLTPEIEYANTFTSAVNSSGIYIRGYMNDVYDWFRLDHVHVTIGPDTTWSRTGGKSFSRLLVALFVDACLRRSASMETTVVGFIQSSDVIP